MKKILCLSLIIFGCFTFTSCNKTSSTSSSYNSETLSTPSSNQIFNGYDFGMFMNEVKGATFENENFDFYNFNATLSYSGSVIISNNDSAYRIGSKVLGGTISIDLVEPILVNSLTFYAKAVENQFSQKIIYNENYSFTINISQEEKVIYNFEEPTLIHSLSFTCRGKDESLFFKGLLIKKAEPIKVEGINKISDIEVEINRYIDISSSYQISPKNATYKDIIISSDDEFIKIEDTKVKALTVGNHIVKITTKEGNYSTFINIFAIEEKILNGFKLLEKPRFIYDDLYKADANYSIVPSKGKVKIIVVPINFYDLVNVYDFKKQENMDKLKAVFEGTKEDNSNDYYESLKSFYYKSSYGNLDLDFVYTDVYTPSFSSTTFNQYTDDYGSETQILIQDMYDKLTINGNPINYNDKSYDANDDGYIDGFWFIYNDDRASTSSKYWPYTYWYRFNDEKKISVYANCSVYFTYEGNDQGLDGHTLFHETGHMLGLDDYYITTSTNYTSSFGGLGMMDYNIGDHDAFSKFSLGWVNPYIVNDDSYINLKPFSTSGECIVIPCTNYNDSPFDEYLIIEYDTPTGLNKFDAENAYVNRPNYFTKNGVRIFHIDARIIKFDGSGYQYLDKDTLNLEGDLTIASSNTPSRSYNNQHLIELITADNRSTYRSKIANNNSLFKEGDIMDPALYTNFFTNSLMHDGSKMEYKIKIDYMDNDLCKIEISK